jgi:ATP-dependent RNA helicase SUPV3L1/SUV3
VNTPSSSALDLNSLDALTGGALTAPTSGERAARLREWMASDPSADLLQQVFKEMSARDKGAAKPLREKLDELRRTKTQDALAQEWADKAAQLLATPRLNLADAMAWARDAAKAGAPLSREPLAGLRVALADRVKHIEDLQHRAQVLRESAVLMVQRIEVLSTKEWMEAVELQASLAADLLRLQTELSALGQDDHWGSVDPKYPNSVSESANHVQLVWDAFSAALTQTQAAAQDASLPLPAVPAWADQLRTLRGEAPLAVVASASKPSVDPVAQAQAKEAQAAAAELAAEQKRQADLVRTDLVTKAEALLKPVPTAPTVATEVPPAAPEWVPVITGRKLQDTLRQLREAWKQADQGGHPNHALWKRFDQACNRAYPFVQAWLEKAKAESAAHRQQRLDLLAEVAAWTQAHAGNTDWKKQARELHAFSERWRNSGHLSEKMFAEMQAQWKTAMQAAHVAIDKAQADSVAQRRALIDEAKQLAAAPSLRIDAVKALQQRWQAESQAVPIDRKLAQKLWDAFRQPLDEAFQRKTQDRAAVPPQALSAHDKAVLEASQALEKAIAQGDASQIRQAMQHLNDVSQGRTAAVKAQTTAAPTPDTPPEIETPTTEALPTEATGEEVAVGEAESDSAVEAAAMSVDPAPAVKVPAPPKKVVAVRGDDRPGQKKTEPAPAGRFGDKPGARRADRDGPSGRRGADAPRSRDAFEPRGPRLGDAAFRAQRHALEQADAALRRLAMQAHGETLVHVLSAWEHRQADQLPSAKDLGSRITAGQRQSWTQALQSSPQSGADHALLRLEMAAEVPTPASHVDARRALQLQLLTKRHEAPPAQTWAQDVAAVLAGPFEAEAARRLQSALKVLLKR